MWSWGGWGQDSRGETVSHVSWCWEQTRGISIEITWERDLRIREMRLWGQRESTVGRAVALHKADLSENPSTVHHQE